MVQTVVLATSIPMKDVIKKFLQAVCGFTAEPQRRSPKTRDIMTWTSSSYSTARELTPSAPLQ
jgi:hypothetical protein